MQEDVNATGYREEPAPRSTGLVCSWTAALPGDAGPYLQRVVPDGCVDLIWHGPDGEIRVAGPDTGPMPAIMRPGDSMVAVRFGPGAAPPVLGVPADAVRDGRPPLRDLWGGSADRLADAMAAAGTDEERRAVLLAAVTERAGAARPADPLVPAVVAGLARGSVRQVSDRLGLGERQLRRRSLAAFGYGPKTLQRVLRFQRALRLAARRATARRRRVRGGLRRPGAFRARGARPGGRARPATCCEASAPRACSVVYPRHSGLVMGVQIRKLTSHPPSSSCAPIRASRWIAMTSSANSLLPKPSGDGARSRG